MCLEDLRMGRKKYTRVTVKQAFQGSSDLLVGASTERTHLTMQTVDNACFIAPSEEFVAAARGYVSNTTTPPLEFDSDVHGDVVTAAWFGGGVALDALVMIIETFYKDNGKV